jgi:hypothetical protein
MDMTADLTGYANYEDSRTSEPLRKYTLFWVPRGSLGPLRVELIDTIYPSLSGA